MKRFLIVLFLLALVACDDAGGVARQADEELAGQQLQVFQNAQPIPIYDWSQVRDTLIQINAMLVEGRQSYAYIVNQLTGEPVFSCPAVGFPIPADTQLTNPDQVVYQGATIAQIEPNGTFTSENTNATYILCIIEGGKAVPVYSEALVIAAGAPLVWNSETRQYTISGEPSMVVDIGQP